MENNRLFEVVGVSKIKAVYPSSIDHLCIKYCRFVSINAHHLLKDSSLANSYFGKYSTMQKINK